jgi:hypothetical protein
MAKVRAGFSFSAHSPGAGLASLSALLLFTRRAHVSEASHRRRRLRHCAPVRTGQAESELEAYEELPDGSCQPGFGDSEPSETLPRSGDTSNDGAPAEEPARDFAARKPSEAKPGASSAELLAPDAMHPD